MLIINGKIYTMEDKPIERGYVRIKGKVIEEVGNMSSLAPSDDEEILDVKGAWVMPGLIEAHCHIGITVLLLT